MLSAVLMIIKSVQHAIGLVHRKSAIFFIANKKYYCLPWWHKNAWLNAIVKSFISINQRKWGRCSQIVNEIYYYDFPGLIPHMKRKGNILSFFTTGHKSPNVSRQSTDLYEQKLNNRLVNTKKVQRKFGPSYLWGHICL